MFDGMMKTWEEILKAFKKNKANENLSIVLEQPYLSLLALAWTKIPKKFKTVPPECKTLEDLWKCVNFDFEDLERATGLSSLAVINGIRLLRLNNLIFPDGTMASSVSGLIRGKIIDTLKMFKGEVK